MAATRPILHRLLTKDNWSLADIAVHILQIKRRNFFLERANEYFFVSGSSN